ncbi:MAG: hypothetical protein R3C24_00715 [Cyanobacteriota/Melainabacteria group bacterium]
MVTTLEVVEAEQDDLLDEAAVEVVQKVTLSGNESSNPFSLMTTSSWSCLETVRRQGVK